MFLKVWHGQEGFIVGHIHVEEFQSHPDFKVLAGVTNDLK